MNENFIETKYAIIKNMIDLHNWHNENQYKIESLGIDYKPYFTQHELQREIELLRAEERKIPEFIYKFMPFPNCEKRKGLKNKIAFSNILTFNDPFEFINNYITEEEYVNHSFVFAGTNSNDMIKCVSEKDKERIKEYNNTWDSIKSNIFVCCLSGNDWKSVPMWGYYTENSTGLCLKYRILDEARKYLHKVEYLEERKMNIHIFREYFKNKEELLRLKENEIPENELKEYENIAFLDTYLASGYTTKYKDWQHEKEYRMLIDVSKIDRKDSGFVNNTKSFLVDLEVCGLQLETIYIGVKQDEEESIKLIKNWGSDNKIEVKKCKIHQTEYMFADNESFE